MKKYYEFSDILIRPIPSKVNSRSDVDISVKLSDDFTLEFPLIATPMREIVDGNFAAKLSDLGGIAILHRFYDTHEELVSEIELLTGKNYGLSIDLDGDFVKLLQYEPRILTVDIANGYIESLRKRCEEIATFISKNKLKTLLMSGNVCTESGVRNLRDSGVNIVRFGLGSGGLCSTRNVTGIGLPTFTALQDCYEVGDVLIACDGGIRDSGDFVKAIVGGADLGLAGSIFAQTYESPAKEKIYGMASQKLNEMMFTRIKSIEGIEKTVEKTKSLEKFVEEFSWGIRSAGTYLNATNLNEIRTNSEAVIIGTGSIKNL